MDETAQRPKAPTIAKVAALAGVSAPTVSRVLNDSGPVKPETRSKVEAAIASLGYRPSPQARALRTGRTPTLACVVPFIAHPSAVDHVRGLVQGLHESDTPVSLYNVEAPQDLDSHVSHLLTVRPAGVVVIALDLGDEVFAAFDEAEVPIVLLDRAHDGVVSVTVDEHGGAEQAVEHLVGLGHRRIGFVGDDEDNVFGFTSSRERRTGLRRALEARGLELEDRYIRLGQHGREVAHAHASELLELDAPPTAFLGASDTQAFGIMDAVRSKGLSVGRDVSVIGFDDVAVAADLGLTSVNGQLSHAGVRAAVLLREMLGSDRRPEPEILDARLVVRESTGPLGR